MKERIKIIRDALHLTQTEFGVKVGVKGNTVTNYENGLRNPSQAVVKAICREFNVDYIWLTTGEGQMFINNDDHLMAMIDNIMFGENEFHKKLFRLVANMDEKDLIALEHIIDNINCYMNTNE